MAAQPKDPRLGVTATMSMEPPQAKDLELDKKLLEELKTQGQFEAPEATATRHAVLKRLEQVLHRLVMRIGKQKGLPPGILESSRGRVFKYGSFELGVYGPGSDIDTLMVGPKHVTREHFFQYMPELLRKEFKPEEITEMTSVPGIAVPIIKLELCSVSIDLIYATLQVSTVPDSLDDINILRGLDETDLKCVNGTRVTRRIIDLVPQTKTFRQALRAIKLWAKQRALYGAVVGFPGGVAFAMMVARICQLYPKAAAPTIVLKFFSLIRRWSWPMPLTLAAHEDAPFQLPEWDPQISYGDRHHQMPVLTPAYPRINSTHTIGPSTMTVLMRELERGEKIVNEVYQGKLLWKDLFRRHTFFSEDYRHYICVITASKTKDGQQAWSGLVQSKVKWLVSGIERSDAKSVELVHPFNKGFERVHECATDDDVEKTLQGSMEFKVKEIKTETTDQTADIKMQVAAQSDTDGTAVPSTNEPAPATTEGPQTIYSTTFYLGIGLKKGANSLDISEPISKFRDVCEQWANFNAQMNSIRIKHMRNYDLPEDIFKDGETRPTRTKKPKAAKGAEGANNKRNAAHAGLEENVDPAKRQQAVNAALPNGAASANGVAG